MPPRGSSALNTLATLQDELGDLDQLRRLVRLTGYVNAPPGFDRQPWVINGASEVFDAVFGEKQPGPTLGATGLPLGMACVIETTFERGSDDAIGSANIGPARSEGRDESLWTDVLRRRVRAAVRRRPWRANTRARGGRPGQPAAGVPARRERSRRGVHPQHRPRMRSTSGCTPST